MRRFFYIEFNGMQENKSALPHYNWKCLNTRLISVGLLVLILYAYYPIYYADFVNYDDLSLIHI